MDVLKHHILLQLIEERLTIFSQALLFLNFLLRPQQNKFSNIFVGAKNVFGRESLLFLWLFCPEASISPSPSRKENQGQRYIQPAAYATPPTRGEEEEQLLAENFFSLQNFCFPNP